MKLRLRDRKMDSLFKQTVSDQTARPKRQRPFVITHG
jgi:hypothetical protein